MVKQVERGSILFEPVRVGNVTLRNRLAMAPMTRLFARDGVHDPRAVDYYARRAHAGIGLIISEGAPPVDPSAPYDPAVPRFDRPAARDRWRDIASAVRATGSHMLVQLWHAGLLRDAAASTHPDVPSIGPSGVFPAASSAPGGELSLPVVGREMTGADIAATVEAFASAAETCQALGFSGIELHAAHGYLFDQFFWSVTNRRADSYGGDWIGRTRIAVEAIQEIRRRTGPQFLIGLRFSQFKPPLYDARLAETPQALEALLTPLANAGLDLIHASTRRFWVPEFDGSPLGLAGWTKKVTGLPTIAVGSVGLSQAFDPRIGAGQEAGRADLDQLEAIMARGDFDIVAIGRSLLANPDWAQVVGKSGASGLRDYEKDHVESLF